jgi:hypothetical protein
MSVIEAERSSRSVPLRGCGTCRRIIAGVSVRHVRSCVRADNVRARNWTGDNIRNSGVNLGRFAVARVGPTHTARTPSSTGNEIPAAVLASAGVARRLHHEKARRRACLRRP